ncbi:MAG: hypothetical protein ACLP01_14640 [Solirubrobacteraceae bacterium]
MSRTPVIAEGATTGKTRVITALDHYKRRLDSRMKVPALAVYLALVLGIGGLYFVGNPHSAQYWWVPAVIALLLVVVPPIFRKVAEPATGPVAAGTGIIAATANLAGVLSIIAVPIRVVLDIRVVLAGVVAAGVVLGLAVLTRPLMGAIVLGVGSLLFLGRLWQLRSRSKVAPGDNDF